MTVSVSSVPYTSYTMGANEAGQLVEDKFTSAQSYADDAITTAQYYLETLANIFGDITLPTSDINYDFQDFVLTDNLSTLRPEAPSSDDLTPNEVADAIRPEFINVPTDITFTPIARPAFNIVDTNISTVSVDSPDIKKVGSVSTTSVPSPSLEGINNDIDVPVISSPGLYSSKDIPLPELERPLFVHVPTDIAVTTAEKPTFDTVTVPTITIPVYDIVEPDSVFSYTEENYYSELNNAIITNVKNIIENGGTGLGEEIEDALWERARDRTVLENERLYNETEDYFAARGYEIPPGMLSGRLLEITKETNRNNQQLNYEITIEQARLAKEHGQFAITAGIQLEGQDKELFNNISNRLLEAAKVAEEIIIKTYEIKVAAYTSRLQATGVEADIAKTMADVVIQSNANLVSIYQSEITAIGHEIEVIKAEISAAVASNDNLISIYEADIKVAGLEAEIAKISVEATTLKNNNLIDIYGKDITLAGMTLEAAKIENDNVIRHNDNLIANYNNEINAANLQITVDKANADIILQDNVNLINVYDKDIAAAGLEVEAAKAEIAGTIDNNANLVNIYQGDIAIAGLEVDIAKAKIGAVVESNNSMVNIYNADIEAYKAKVSIELSIIENIAKVYGYKIAGYEADAKAAAILLDSQIEEFKARISQANNQTTLSLKEAELTLQGYLGAMGLTTEGQKAISNISAQLAASALSSVNASASLGDSVSQGITKGYSYNHSLSNSANLSEQQYYPHAES